jgi:hypothetical protein
VLLQRNEGVADQVGGGFMSCVQDEDAVSTWSGVRSCADAAVTESKMAAAID